jgi:hypothetical protein
VTDQEMHRRPPKLEAGSCFGGIVQPRKSAVDIANTEPASGVAGYTPTTVPAGSTLRAEARTSPRRAKGFASLRFGNASRGRDGDVAAQTYARDLEGLVVPLG